MSKPKLIAEISANHCGNFYIAKKLIKCARDNGADYVKLQTYTADSMTIRSTKKDFQINQGLWKGYDLWDLYNKAKTPLDWHKKLFNYAKKIGIKIFSTPFDEDAVDFLENLNCPIYKISSFEMTDLPLVKKIAKTGKPMIISTGTSSLIEIERTYKFAKKHGAKNITLMYCVSNYPSKISDFNLHNIDVLKKKFNCKVGLSDHSKGSLVAALAVSRGAVIFEKHIALEMQKKGIDIEFSAKGREILEYKKTIIDIYNISKKKYFFRNISEKKGKQFRRSIYAVKKIKKGEKFTKENIRRIRPGYGMLPKYYTFLINKISPKNYSPGEPLNKKQFKYIKNI